MTLNMKLILLGSFEQLSVLNINFHQTEIFFNKKISKDRTFLMW
jgi:hypothetical protein